MEVATYLLEFFLLLEVTAVQAAVLLLLTHRAADFHVEHVFQPSDNLEKAVSSFKAGERGAERSYWRGIKCYLCGLCVVVWVKVFYVKSHNINCGNTSRGAVTWDRGTCGVYLWACIAALRRT